MILVNGSILSSNEIINILPTLEKRLCKTLNKPLLNPMLVVEACHQLAVKIEQGCYQELLMQLITEEHITAEQINNVVNMFKRDNLLYKINLELGKAPDNRKLSTLDKKNGSIIVKRMPLGVLFHIAAGNVDGLPAYSVIEGLLAGNINILKLPASDHGLTITLLYELIKLEPVLSDYIYVFDTSSNELASMQAMAKCADAIVVWGGDTAIGEVRKLATPNTRIIEWGHKISFAYVTEMGMDDSDLTELAHHILNTKQLLCSSCQGIYLDTHEIANIYHFSERFLAVMEKVALDYPSQGVGIQAQLTLLLYNQELEAIKSGKKIYRGKNCSISASSDKKLEVSFTYGNCWVKALPREYIISRLHRYKGYLQTVGLLCGQEEREELSGLLLRAGATRITNAGDMSRMVSGEAHDGEYPLIRYSKIVEYTCRD